MTKSEEQKLLKRLSNLEKQVARVYEKIENNNIEKHMYSVAETARLLGVSNKTVYNMIEKGQLDVVMLGHTKVLGSSLKEKLGVS